MCIRILEPSKTSEEEEELKPRHIESMNYDVIDDAIIASPNSDVILRNVEINRLIARKRYVPRKRSLMHSVGSFGRSLRACSRTITFMALLLAIVINVTGGLVNIRPSEGKSTVGNSPSLPLSGQIYFLRCPASLFLYILRDLAAFILCINEGFCHCMLTEAIWNNNKPLRRRMEILNKTVMCEERRLQLKHGERLDVYPGYVTCELATFAKRTFFWRETLGYIFIPVRGLLGFQYILFGYIYGKS